MTIPVHILVICWRGLGHCFVKILIVLSVTFTSVIFSKLISELFRAVMGKALQIMNDYGEDNVLIRLYSENNGVCISSVDYRKATYSIMMGWVKKNLLPGAHECYFEKVRYGVSVQCTVCCQ